MHCYRSYTPRITLCGAIVAGVMSRKEAGEKFLLFPSNSGRLLKGSSKEDKKISADDIVRFLTHFSVSRAIKDSVMEAGPLGRPQRPRHARRSGECDHDAVQVAVEVKSCAVAPSKTDKNCHYVEEVDSPRDYDEKLAVDGQGLLHSRVCFMSPAKVRSGPSLSSHCS